jgi:hypothetical protein
MPPPEPPERLAAGRAIAVSAIDSHSPHCGQRPCHFGLAKPQLLQTYWLVALGIVILALFQR